MNLLIDQVQEAVTSRPWEAVRMLLKEGWLPDRMLNKVSTP